VDDYKDQTSAKTVQPTELSDRLLNRWVQSPGVIDLRHPEQRYNITAGFAAERLPLLDRLNARRGVEVQTPAGGQEFAMVRKVIENTMGIENTGAYSSASQQFSAQSSQSGTSEIRAERLADSVTDNSLSGKVRISRKPAQPTPSTSRAESSEASVKSEASGNSQPIPSGQPIQSSQSPAGRVSSSFPLMLQKKTIQTKTDAQDGSSKSGESQNVVIQRSDLHPREARASVNESVPGAPPVTAMRLRDKKPISGAQETQPIVVSKPASTEGPTSQRPELLVFRKVSTDKSEDSHESQELRQSVIQTAMQESAAQPARDARQSAEMSSLPLIKPRGPAPHIQRQAQSGQVYKEMISTVSERSSQYEQESAAGKQNAQPVVIREMRNNPAAPSSLVWRKSARQTTAEPAPKLTASTALIARQIDSSTVSRTPSRGNEIVAPQSAQSGSRINMGKIIQEVIRAISRNIEVERERRG
jgi:hypothetical protein